MENYLHILIYNNFIDYFIYFLVIINIIFINIIDFINEKKNYKKTFKRKYNTIEKSEIIYGIISILLFIIIFAVFSNDVMKALAFMFLIITQITKSIVNSLLSKNINSYKMKFSNTSGSLFYIIFFSSFTVKVFINQVKDLSIYDQNILLAFYLTIKIFLATFVIAANTIIFLSNYSELFTKKKTKKAKEQFIIKLYDYNLFQKYNNCFTYLIDSLIYIFVFTPILIINSILEFIYKKTTSFKNYKLKIIDYLRNQSNYSLIFKKIVLLSIFVSLALVNIFLIVSPILNKNAFKDIYSFISTVILIPIVYDLIKTKEKDL